MSPRTTLASARGTSRAALAYDPDAAIARLRRADRDLGRIIRRVGAFEMRTREAMTPFAVLLASICSQQISGKAAASIRGRLEGLFPRRRPTPRRLLELDEAALRGAGLSRSKILAARDLAAKTIDGVVPTRARLARMDDDAIVERLTEVRGIGRWTVEMLLIFHLGRPDVLPDGDLGVRRGYMIARGDDDLPSPAALREHGERWRPYRSVASWYLWQATYL